jgi:hypothetical protein
MRSRFPALFLLLAMAGAPNWAADGTPASNIAFSGSLRSRLELWDWFEGTANNRYAFDGNILRLGISQKRARFDWSLELAAPILLSLPDDALAPAPQGPLGLGANYFADNSRKRNAAMVFPKQVWLAVHGEEARGHSLQLGRFEFSDGAEVTPKNPALAALKNTRIRERLIGPFGFVHVGRSFDGFHYGYQAGAGRLTVVGAVPTRGVFQTDGWGWTKTGVGYLSWTRPVTAGNGAGELRLFGLYYQDWRPLAKTDNRAAAARLADTGNVRVETFGGHYLHVLPSPVGPADLLVWGAGQTGRWGRLDHRAWAVAIEGGWQPKKPVRLKPWLRGGVFASSGDPDPNDGEHRTFFQILPTPRIYARFPFFNLMNLEDYFGELILRPHPKVSVRSDVHGLRLRESRDLWYAGGGAYNPWSFGYAGRPSRGGRGLATLYDTNVDVSATKTLTVSGYYGYARGRSVIGAIYPERRNAQFAYLELSYRF